MFEIWIQSKYPDLRSHGNPLRNLLLCGSRYYALLRTPGFPKEYNAIRDLAEEIEKLSNELAWFRRQLFGSKTEHYIPRYDTPSL